MNPIVLDRSRGKGTRGEVQGARKSKGSISSRKDPRLTRNYGARTWGTISLGNYFYWTSRSFPVFTSKTKPRIVISLRTQV